MFSVRKLQKRPDQVGEMAEERRIKLAVWILAEILAEKCQQDIHMDDVLPAFKAQQLKSSVKYRNTSGIVRFNTFGTTAQLCLSEYK